MIGSSTGRRFRRSGALLRDEMRPVQRPTVPARESRLSRFPRHGILRLSIALATLVCAATTVAEVRIRMTDVPEWVYSYHPVPAPIIASRLRGAQSHDADYPS